MSKDEGKSSVNGVVSALLFACTVVGVIRACSPSTSSTSTTPVAQATSQPSQPVEAGTQSSSGLSTPADLDFTYDADSWKIEGNLLGQGNSFVCRMLKDSAQGTRFAYLTGISVGGDGMNNWALFITKTGFPNGVHPMVTVAFDGMKMAPVKGRVDGGYVSIDWSKQSLSVMKKAIDLLDNRKRLRLTVSMDTWTPEITDVDLEGSSRATDINGVCMKSLMDMGMAKMQGKH